MIIHITVSYHMMLVDNIIGSISLSSFFNRNIDFIYKQSEFKVVELSFEFNVNTFIMSSNCDKWTAR